MISKYQTLSEPSQGEYKDKGSKFIAFAFPVKSEDECKKIISQVKEEHPKSRHICYAFRIGIESVLERTNDAGEPSGTAGKPIIGQIHSSGLHNVLVVVVRYFGGTLLGIPGLIQAYKSAAQHALNNGKFTTKKTIAVFELQFGYATYNELMNFFKRENITLLDQEMGENCRMVIGIEIEKNSHFERILGNFSYVKYKFLKYE